MKKMTWTVTLADGTALEGLGLNGNNFISTRKLTDADFAGKLEHVTITDGETTTELTNVELVQCVQYGTEYWFVLRELSARELLDAKTIGDIEYIAMMAGINLEEV